jgi:hypothetical protein
MPEENKKVFKYMCSTNRDGADGTTGCFRQSCDLCNCAPFGKMVLDPGKVLTEEAKELVCPHTGVPLELKDYWEELPSQPVIMGFRLNENQIRADRLKRSDNDFKKNIFDTLPDSDKRALARGKPDLEARLAKIPNKKVITKK